MSQPLKRKSEQETNSTKKANSNENNESLQEQSQSSESQSSQSQSSQAANRSERLDKIIMNLLPKILKTDEQEGIIQIQQSIKTQIAMYRRLLSEPANMSYAELIDRAAYVYMFVPFHVECFLSVLDKLTSEYLPFLNMLNALGRGHSEEPEVLCLGGGPGSDILGLKMFLEELGERKVLIDTTDGSPFWQATWNRVRSFLSPFDVNYNTHQFGKQESLKVMQQSDYGGIKLVTAIKFLSAICSLDTESANIRNEQFKVILNAMSEGSFFLVIDNQNPLDRPDRFTEWIKPIAGECRFSLIRSDKQLQVTISRLPCYKAWKDIVGMHPTGASKDRVLFLLFQKQTRTDQQ